ARPSTDALARGSGLAREALRIAHAELDGAVPAAQRRVAEDAGPHVLPVRERLRRRRFGHRIPVGDALLRAREARFEGEDRLAALERDHATRGEAAAVADPGDPATDRHLVAPGPQEVAVQRMEHAGLDRAPRGHDGLRGHHAAEEPALAIAGVAEEEV